MRPRASSPAPMITTSLFICFPPFFDDAVEGHRHGVLEPGFGVEAGADLVELREVGAGDGEGAVVGLEPAGGGVGGHAGLLAVPHALEYPESDSFSDGFAPGGRRAGTMAPMIRVAPALSEYAARH